MSCAPIEPGARPFGLLPATAVPTPDPGAVSGPEKKSQKIPGISLTRRGGGRCRLTYSWTGVSAAFAAHGRCEEGSFFAEEEIMLRGFKHNLLVLSSFGAVVWAGSPAIAQTDACCFDSPPGLGKFCWVTDTISCSVIFGVYAGNGTSCSTAACLGATRGACCNSSEAACILVDGGQPACTADIFGTYLGDGTRCVEDSDTSFDNCPTCGDNQVNGPGEQCDGTSAANCGGRPCLSNCTCTPPPGQVCGNNVREGSEQCDGTSSSACPGLCRQDCTCPGSVAAPAVSEWGMAILMLSLLAGVTLKFRSRIAPGAQ